MEIKTIAKRVDDATTFDRLVNDSLKDGWHLHKREVIPAPNDHTKTFLYAELVKLDEANTEPAGGSWQDAIKTLKATCLDADECSEACSMHEWCQKHLPDECPPSSWAIPGEKVLNYD